MTREHVYETIAPFLSTEFAVGYNNSVRMVGDWVRDTRNRANSMTPPAALAGGKYLQLSLLGKQMIEVCGERLVLLVADRDIEESIASLKRRCGAGKPIGKIRAHQEWLAAGREAFVAMMPESSVLRVSYSTLLQSPRPEVQRIADFLDLTPTDTQTDAAVRSIVPAMRHVNLAQGAKA